MKSPDTIIFNIAGGVGKNIVATAVVHSIKKAYPKATIIISSPWKDVWQHNPNISQVINLETTPNFCADFLYKKNVKMCFLDPYNDPDFINRKEHIIDVWCRLCGVESITKIPELYFTEDEKQKTKEKLFDRISEEEKQKPLFFIQPSGGATNQPYPISWARDLPLKTAEAIVLKMNKEGYRTIHLRRIDQIPVLGAEWIDFSMREAMCAIQFSNKRLFVDSFASHTSGAMQLKSVITWITNSPKSFGYDSNINIEAFPNNKNNIEFRHNPDAYLDEYNIAGIWSEHPFKDDEIFDAEEILKYLI